MKLLELVNSIEYSCDKEIDNIHVEDITTSPKKISSGTLFVIIRSISFDINKIVAYVLSCNPVAIVCDYDLLIDSNSIPIIRCESTRRILPYLYSNYYKIDYSKMRFCAVTGTNGKTTTATMLSHILTHSEKKVGFIGTGKIIINGNQITDNKYSMTTPDPDLLYPVVKKMQNAGCEFVIMEVSSHALYFEKVSPIPFEVSIFTNLSSEHMDFHKNINEYFQTKLRLFSQTKTGIFNMDDSYSRKAFDTATCKKTSIGIVQDAEAMAKDVVMNGLLGSKYIYRETNRLFMVKLQLGGAFNIYNSMMAIAAAISLGIKPCIAKEAISKLDFIDGRLEIIEDEITVIIDYAHTESALSNVLKTIKSSKKQQQKVTTVFGCGGNRDVLKRPKMAQVAEELSDFVIVTTDNSRNESEANIIKDILQGFHSTTKRKVITSRKAAIEYAILSAEKNDIVTIIGKGHERYNIDKDGYRYFDEREIIKEALKKRKLNHENNTKAAYNT